MYSHCISDYLIQDVWFTFISTTSKLSLRVSACLLSYSQSLYFLNMHMWNVVCLVERGEGKKRKEAFFRVLPPCLFFTKNPFPVRKKQNKPTHTCVHRGWSLTLREVREVSTCRYAHLRKPVNRSHVFSVLHDTCSSGLWHGGERNSLWARVALPLVHRTHARAQRCPTAQANTDLGISGAAEGLWLKFVLPL